MRRTILEPRVDFHKLIKTAAGMLATNHIWKSLGIDSTEANHRCAGVKRARQHSTLVKGRPWIGRIWRALGSLMAISEKRMKTRNNRPAGTDMLEDRDTLGSESSTLRIPAGEVTLSGDLEIPENAIGLVLFAHGSGSSRRSPRNQAVAEARWFQKHLGAR